MKDIEQLAIEILDEKEIQLAKRLAFFLENGSSDSSILVRNIIPAYEQQVGDMHLIFNPDNIYRPLFYIHSWSSLDDFKNITGEYVEIMRNHLEGCLENLASLPKGDVARSKTLGPLIARLGKAGVLSPDISKRLSQFDTASGVPARHIRDCAPSRKPDERAFTIMETAFALVIMRKLSIQLFTLLQASGVTLPQEWPGFSDEWLSWYPKND